MPARLLDPPPDAGGVDEQPVRPSSSTTSSTGSTSCRRRRRPRRAHAPASLLSRRRLADVGLADSATRRGPRRHGVESPGRLRHRGEHRVEQVTTAPAVQRRHRIRLAQSQVPQAAASASPARSSTLFAARITGLPGAAQDPHHVFVGVGDCRPSRPPRTAPRRPRPTAISAWAVIRRGQAPSVGVPATGVDQGERRRSSSRRRPPGCGSRPVRPGRRPRGGRGSG